MAKRNQFEVAGRSGTAKAIRSFRAALRAGDCKRAGVYLDIFEAGHARRATVYQLTDKFYSAGCKRQWEKR